jgi:hypothetical protein
MPDEPAYPRVVLDLEVEVTTRLMAMLKAMPARERRRFRSAAERAAHALEGSCPAVLGMTSNGMIAGLFANTAPGRLSVVIASADDCIMFAPELRALPAAVADLEAFLSETGEDHSAVRGNLPLMLAAILKARSLASPGLGALFVEPGHREQAEVWATEGATPALVALLSKDGKGSVRLPLPHGRTFPVLEFEPEVAGHA